MAERERLRRDRRRRRVRRSERGGAADADTAPGCWCSKRAPASAAVRPRFRSRDRRARRQRPARPARLLHGHVRVPRDIGAADDVRLQPQLAVTMIDRAGTAIATRLSRAAVAVAPAGRRPRLGRAVVARSAVGARHGAPLRLARRALQPGRRVKAASPGETVENWLIRNGQTARLREMLWDPLALAALNQPPQQAAAPMFARVLAEMFGGDPRAAAIALPTRPLHRCTPSRRARSSSAAAERCGPGRPRRIRVRTAAVAASRPAARRGRRIA